MLKTNKLKLIVTGTGRCGTVFFAKMLSSIGFSCGHESIFDYSSDEIIINRLSKNERTLSLCSQKNDFINKKSEKKWINPKNTIADSSYLAAPYLSHPFLTEVSVIHLFRDPFKVISSYILDFNYFSDKFANNKNPYNVLGWENKIYKTLPELCSIDSQIERACWFYIRWNQIIKDSCKFRPYLQINIDNIDYNKVFDFLNIDKSNVSNLYDYKKSNTNKKREKDLVENDISNDLLKNILKNYNNI